MEKETYLHHANFTQADNVQATVSLVISLIAFASVFLLPNILFPIFFGGMVVRLFIIFHDLNHNAYFSSRTVNKIVAHFLAPLILTPVSSWTKQHQLHHADSNKTDKQQYAQTAPLAVLDYLELSLFEKFKYKLFYGKHTVFLITPSYYFLIELQWASYLYEKIITLGYLAALYSVVPSNRYAYLFAGYVLSATFGFILFHLQHTFDNVYRKPSNEWKQYENGIYGSSYLKIPLILKFFTFGVEYHHIHHITPTIPCYRLEECYKAYKFLYQDAQRVYLTDLLYTYYYSIYNGTYFADVYQY